LLRRIGGGAYGEVWLARSATGALRALKIVHRSTFEDDRPFQREFEGIQRFERISREHPGQLALFHIGRNEAEGYFYYVMELADAAQGEKEKGGKGVEESTSSALAASLPRPLGSHRPLGRKRPRTGGRPHAQTLLALGARLSAAAAFGPGNDWRTSPALPLATRCGWGQPRSAK
jgi:hypothetical protein